ncbi:TetR/AcrR family transcriptional regulator [Solwaraspora sp. WMMD1047]|uniref:TetR/AcrR family transcriptional regulator n=1 Tax=Solwaraspora sp. WMMD1047 TaxID=3016102 RepID=UPI00241762B8|nr:TetR/AcrR family transcriptional regulator [Solwaraspora sp. WMMD1047]MDG4828769.1 TetR/AcrR family transcriptional regulator [Solwaraspora sp. WMMD1047]
MSEVREPKRRQRADARRSIAAVLDAAVALLGRRPDASMDEIAATAGVSRQTIYAHYSSRDALLHAVTRHITAEVARELGGLDLDRGSTVEALARWVDASWTLLERYPVLLTPAIAAPGGDEQERHEPVTDGLVRLLDRGRRCREFDRAMPTTWYVAAIIGLGHAAGQEVIAGRMTQAEAGAAFREGVLRVCRAPN